MNRLILGLALILLIYFNFLSAKENLMVEESLCEDSTLGKQTCISNVTSFMQIQERLPITDEEMAAVYGCYKLNFLEKIFSNNSNMFVCED